MLVYTATVDGQDCSLPQISDLGDTTAPSPLGLLPATFALLTNQGFPALQIHQLNIVCLSQGSVRDTYGSTSLVVRYFDAQSSTTFTIQVDYRCDESGEWANGRFASLLLFPTATLTTQLRTDCAICQNPQGIQTYTPTAEEHCAGEYCQQWVWSPSKFVAMGVVTLQKYVAMVVVTLQKCVVTLQKYVAMGVVTLQIWVWSPYKIYSNGCGHLEKICSNGCGHLEKMQQWVWSPCKNMQQWVWSPCKNMQQWVWSPCKNMQQWVWSP